MQEKDGKYIFGVVKVGDKGQIVIPRDVRKMYDIKPGDTLMLLGDQKGMDSAYGVCCNFGYCTRCNNVG
ncbi:MAG: AbrB/MazE/SpoVT family DNA-binding domain-containing protein [Bacteroidales bacterium]|jgi:AbrB family looped-hinge helix DNA binding protein|nr:AbrB/MazE/SpoVT family DNA-binding domain-containing protein [Bacteroidales bacterium]